MTALAMTTTAEPRRRRIEDLPDSPAADYARVARAVEYLGANWHEHPSLDEVAAHVRLSPAHFQRLFTRWAGISPKQFIQAITLDNARDMLRSSASVLDAAYEVGLSGPGRLHDLFVAYEAMTPGDYKAGGEGLEIAWGFHDSPFGTTLAMATDRGLAGIAFADGGPEGRARALADMMARWPRARFVEEPARTAPYVAHGFDPRRWSADRPLKVVLIGSEFDVTVWQTLLRIPAGCVVTYSDIAAHIGRPKAARAVGTAVGRNPVSFVVPCHRVLRKSGELGGYHWGLTRKRAIIGWESARAGNA
jgi:AraC family transcriptional regulator of adaptative response/methylated-DNA-[protein]-cysteine methyltransferase